MSVLVAFSVTPLGVGLEYFPENMPPAQLLVDVETPVGTRAGVTDSILRKLEAELADVSGREDWESVVAVAGGGGGHRRQGWERGAAAHSNARALPVCPARPSPRRTIVPWWAAR